MIKSRNARWPSAATDAGAASRVVLCGRTEDVVDALNQMIGAGMWPMVRSGGHCYEDFVANNPNGAIIDLGLRSCTRLRRWRGAQGDALSK
jgi:FAD/FMN-containing dehydrogenase